MLRGAALVLLVTGCAELGMMDDGTSVSFGPPSRGALIDAVELPRSGEGYRVPRTWADRGLRYGTLELVSFVVHLGRSLEPLRLGRPVAVADLSPAHGGPSAWHRSHQTGRDVDLIFFARDAAGRPVMAEAMRRYGADGIALPERGRPQLHFDDAANWALVRAILENPVAEVEHIFISDDLKQRVIERAVASGAPPELIEAAAYLLHQPTGALPHDDHMHVRIDCAPSDLALGCGQTGRLRWRKKDFKYRLDRLRRTADRSAIGQTLSAQKFVLTALPGLPFRGFVPK